MSQYGHASGSYRWAGDPRTGWVNAFCSGVWSKCRTWLLLMSEPILVQIIGAPIACVDGVKDSWRDFSRWMAARLRGRYGETVKVQYFDLLHPDCPPIPLDAQLPLVLVAGAVLSSGGKISEVLIRRQIEVLIAGQVPSSNL
jgi:hypothetical protein